MTPDFHKCDLSHDIHIKMKLKLLLFTNHNSIHRFNIQLQLYVLMYG